MSSTLTHLQCSRPTCGTVFDHTAPRNLCPQCQGPLLARYDLSAARRTLTRKALATRPASMWRYEEVMPGAPPVTLGEGMTPLLRAGRLGHHLGLDRLYIKDEGQNPTASFKARGLSAAVTMAKALGIDTIALPTAGNAGGAAAFDQFPLSIALDGTLVFTEVRLGSGNDLWTLPPGGEPVPWFATTAEELHARVSPNGRLAAYSSDESGRREVYVQPLRGARERVQVSTEGGFPTGLVAEGEPHFLPAREHHDGG